MANFLFRFKKAIGIFFYYYLRPDNALLGSIGKNSNIARPADIKGPENIHLGNNVRIGCKSTFMAKGGGRCVIKDNTGSAEGLTVICSNHRQKIGEKLTGSNDNNEYFELIIEEDVWLGYNVTLLPGTHIGRGAIIGAGAVVRSSVPPYAIVIGNPARVVGFKFTPSEIIQHELVLYKEEERLPRELLDENFRKYFLSKIKDVKEFIKL